MELLSLLIYIVLLGLGFYLLWWFLGVVALPEPFAKVAQVLIGLFAIIILFSLIFGLMPMPPLLKLR